MAEMAQREPFLVGFATCMYQTAGCANSAWADWEEAVGCCGAPRIAEGQRCGVSCDFWNLYEEDIERAAALGATCFRLSIDWSRLCPRGPDDLDSAAVQRYHEILDALLRRGLTPFATIQHIAYPRWLATLGGFESEASILLFAQYAQTCFRLFGSKVRFWTTFNEANVVAFTGYVYGSFPPGHVGRLARCGRALLHMLRAHTQAHAAIKAMPGGEYAQVGLVHNWFSFEPRQADCCGCCAPFYVSWLCRVLNRVWANEVTLRYLATGEFHWKPVWFLPALTYKEPGGRPGCDYIGLNYYSRSVIDWRLRPTCNRGEVMTDMPYCIYPQGLLPAIEGVSRLGVPIYITETGIADSGDQRRRKLMESYLPEVVKAVEAGYDVRGLMWWSLVDNFEWAEGFTKKFGVFEWHPDDSQRRIPRESAALLGKWFKKLPAEVEEIRAAAARRQQQSAQGGGKKGA